jgi:hypothetical protein
MDHICVMVCQNGAQTLFQLVEVSAASDAARLVKEGRVPGVMIDVTLPAKQLAAIPARSSGAESVKLIVVNVNAGNDGDAAGFVAQRVGRCH